MGGGENINIRMGVMGEYATTYQFQSFKVLRVWIHLCCGEQVIRTYDGSPHEASDAFLSPSHPLSTKHHRHGKRKTKHFSLPTLRKPGFAL